jgi:hypothetical protein
MTEAARSGKRNNAIFGPNLVSDGLYLILRHFCQLPPVIEAANVLVYWCASDDEHIALAARCGVANILGAGPYGNAMIVGLQLLGTN